MKNIDYLLVLSIFLAAACSQADPLATITVSESQGLERDLSYVSAFIPIPDDKVEVGNLVATDTENGTTVPIQIVNRMDHEEKSLQIVFPVSIAANASNNYQINFSEKDPLEYPSEIAADTFHVQNDTYKILFSNYDAQRGGQITGIILKNFQDQLLKRGHISMHWAPNFSKSDSEKYFNLENLSAASDNKLVTGRYQIVKERSGITDSVPEIDVVGKYTFYDGLPYFHFESTITMNADVELDLLRNDEMTMDSLFTHVIYQEKGKEPEHLALYGDDKSIFEGRPITDQADFVGFYHKEKGYGLASIRLLYDNTNVDGNPSPTSRPYTKITASSNNGRYWNRVLSDTIQSFPKGSRYQEINAYLIFEVDKAFPEKEILYYQDRLRNPLKVTVGISGREASAAQG